ncbi:CPBP family intramembrane glutamic endopeptidase [Flexivirga caeni]|nr:CPBP family intramembrane glutamic endopeptidase [Flexivirga caeni]
MRLELLGSRGRAAALVTAVAAGAPLLRRAIRSPAGSPEFRSRTVGLAAWWAGCAAIGGRPRAGGGVLPAAVTGAATAGVFGAGALLTRRIPPLRDQVAAVTAHASKGNLPTVAALTALTGVGEELVFRGPLFDLAEDGPAPVVVSTGVYLAITLATGNPMLAFAAIPVGILAGALRAQTGGVVAPCVFHVTWSLAMLVLLPATHDASPV